MDGDSAPLAAIHAATQAAGAVLLVDDAHGVGVVGDEGRGSCAAQAVRPELLVVTFGKAFGVSGAAVLCDEAMADYLLQFAPSSDLQHRDAARPGGGVERCPGDHS
ncbi:8-amino-7-oxononanoate synthase [Klebsiella pneumoniae]|uniref:8-amino-7-oxononanoate synthase n=1 Tax=Klebsiella pneumoniae TaxID=573 RepID=A0A3S4KKL9_KLEPN|nr:8-amino-7-oxononanoate synthase [Klebsiella pneumoniae]